MQCYGVVKVWKQLRRDKVARCPPVTVGAADAPLRIARVFGAAGSSYHCA